MRFLRRPSSYILFAAAAFFLAPAAHADVRPGSGGACNFSRSAFFCSDAEDKAKAVVQFCLQTNAQQCVAAGGDFQQAAAHPNTYRESSSLTSCSMAAQMSWECRTRRNSQNDATGGCQTSAVADNCAAADTAARWDAIECL